MFVCSVVLLAPTTGLAKFDSKKRPEIQKEAAKTTTRGVILLNKKVVSKYLKGYDYVVVDYNFAYNRLALKPVKKPGKNAVRIYLARTGKVAVLVQKNLLKHAGADISKGKYYECEWNAERGVIVINYGGPITRDKLEKEEKGKSK